MINQEFSYFLFATGQQECAPEPTTYGTGQQNWRSEPNDFATGHFRNSFVLDWTFSREAYKG
jgi:hypothetical protein